MNGIAQSLNILPNIITPATAALATVTIDAKGRVTAISAAPTTGSGSVVLAISPTIVTPTILNLTNMQHAHTSAASGGNLDAAAIGSGVLANARVNWAAPSAIGSTTPAAITGTTITANTKFVGSRLEPASDSTTAIIMGKAAGGAAVVTVDTTNSRVGIGGTPGFQLDIQAGSGSAKARVYSSDTASFQQLILGDGVGAGGHASAVFEVINELSALTTRRNNFEIFNQSTTGAITFHTNNDTTPRLSISSTGVSTFLTIDTATLAVTNVIRAAHALTTGSAGDGIGASIDFQSADSTTAIGATVALAAISAYMPVATHVSRTGAVDFKVTDNAATRTVLSIGANGSAPTFAVLGATRAVQQTGGSATASGTYGATEQTMLQKVYDMARTFGFLS